MKKLSIILTALFFIAVLEINAQENAVTGIDFEKGTWTEIVAKAKAENKLIFLDAYASWCGPCKHMAKNIFTQEEVAAFYNRNFINAKIDMEKGEGVEIAKKYNVKSYPTFLFIDGDGSVMHQACGVKEAKPFITLGETAFEDHRTTSAFMKNFEGSELTVTFMNDYLNVLSDACISTKEPLSTYFNKYPVQEYMDFENISLFLEYVRDNKNPMFQELVKKQYDFHETLNNDQVDNKLIDVYSYSFKLASRNKDKNEFDRLQREIIANKLIVSEELMLKSDMIWYRYQKNWGKYASTAKSYVPAFAIDDYRELNSIAWAFYENVENEEALTNALGWIETSLKLKSEYSNMDTYAALLYKLGKKEDALNAAHKAMRMAEEEGISAVDTDELIEKIHAL
ncbi:MAG: DUF255 domain-containing protein [Bacteroidia bacterium]|nr:DUF255 domain-containing protein [Bacteroidia bacterium]